MSAIPSGARPRATFAYARLTWVAFVFGCVFAALSLSPGYVRGDGPYWQNPFGDVATGEIGWFYYARDNWHFPLGATTAYHAPEGSNIALSDSLPLFALPAKLLYQMAWPTGTAPPIYIGLWMALCFVLQAVAASRLLRALGVFDVVMHFAGVALLCYAPILFLRVGHVTLMAQFLILFALEGYVRAKHDGLRPLQWMAVCALAPLALLVHPYLAAMSGAVVAATILDQWRDGCINVRGVLLRFGSIAAAAVGVIFVVGLFNPGRDFGDYGGYSLNLLSPWVPFPQTLGGRLLHTQFPNLPGTSQWEGGAYLGAGVLLLGVFALPALRNWRANLRRHCVLLLIVVGTLVFAVSNRVGLGSSELLHVPLSDTLLHLFSQLRGSGRFVWVAVYSLGAALIVAVARLYARAAAMLLLVVAALLQIADLWPMQGDVYRASAVATPWSINQPEWMRLIGAHQRIFQFPSFECGGLFGGEIAGSPLRELEFGWIAAQLGKPTNSAYLARFSKDCARERADAAARHGEPGTLYLYRSNDETGAYLARARVDLSHCGYLDDVVVCSADQDLSRLR